MGKLTSQKGHKLKKRIELHKKQLEFYLSKDKYTLYSGGVGSGKTFVGAFWAVTQIINQLGITGLITANTHGQLRKAVLPQVIEILTDFGIPFEYKINQGALIVNNETTVYFISLDVPNNLRGVNAGWGWSDECAFYDEQAFKILIGRIRDKRGSGQWKGTTTPNGYNYLYNFFVQEPLFSSRVIFGSSLDNAKNLNEEYISSLTTLYDTKLAQQEIEGKFVMSNSGLIYHAFDRPTHTLETNSKEKLLILGQDFNVHPMCGVFCYKMPNGLYATDELYLENSNTFRIHKEVQKKFPSWRVQILPDETGNRRKSAAAKTDHQILRDDGYELIPFKNPPVKDRVNNLNRLFTHKMAFIDKKNCPKLIKDMEMLTHDNDNDMLGHMADGFGYVAWHLFPMKKPKRDSRIIVL